MEGFLIIFNEYVTISYGLTNLMMYMSIIVQTLLVLNQRQIVAKLYMLILH